MIILIAERTGQRVCELLGYTCPAANWMDEVVWMSKIEGETVVAVYFD